MNKKSSFGVQSSPWFEFIDIKLDSCLNINPTTAVRCCTTKTITFDSFRSNGIEPPSDPLDLSAIKIEPINTLELDYKGAENEVIIRKAYDYGDHNYASISKLDHSYAKSFDQHLEEIEETIQNEKLICFCIDLTNEENILKEEKIISEKEEIISEEKMLTEELLLKEEEKIIGEEILIKETIVNKEKILIEEITLKEEKIEYEEEIVSEKTKILSNKKDVNEENIQEINLNFAKLIEEAFKNQLEVTENQPEMSQDQTSKKWQIDVDTLLKTLYLKENGISVSNNLPVKPLESTPIIDILSKNDDILTVNDKNIQHRNGKSIFKCSTCDYSTIYESIMKNHIKIHTKRKKSPYHCSDCSYKTEYKNKLNIHKKTHSKNLYKCPECIYSNKNMELLIKHLDLHANILPYICNTCCYRTKDELSLTEHKKIHQGSFTCSLCGFTTNKTLIMETHMVIHVKKKSYRCYKCDFVTWYVNELILHKQSHLKVVKCDVCNKKMSGKAFEVHRKNHTCKCQECDFVTASKGTLKVHIMNVHTVKTFR